jgi:heme-degrading monooxygenase HmoA
MFVVVWQFEIAEEKVAGFEATYGPEGTWAKLFRTSPDYLGTELLRDAYISGSYLTVDRWASEDAFRAFRKDHDADYEKLDRDCDALTSKPNRFKGLLAARAASPFLRYYPYPLLRYPATIRTNSNPSRCAFPVLHI